MVGYLPLRSGPAPSGGASSDQENEAATTGFVGAWAQYEQAMLRDVRANIQPNVRTQVVARGQPWKIIQKLLADCSVSSEYEAVGKASWRSPADGKVCTGLNRR
jgi:hypothetical protein